MKTFQYKTNINCGGCIAKVTPFLDKVPGIMKWQVDTASSSKVLTVEVNTAISHSIETAVKNAGFKIEPMAQS